MSEKSGKASGLAAAVVAIINLLTMMLCLTVFTISLWLITAPSSLLNFVRNFGSPFMKALFTEDSLSLQVAVSGALISVFFIGISFMGLYGVISGSQFLLFMYATLVLLLLLLECAVTYYLSSNLLQKGLQGQDVHFNHVIRSTLGCCENRSSAVEVELPWSCCDVSYTRNCTVETMHTLDCQNAIVSFLERCETPFYISLVSFHVILLSCSLLRRCLSRPHT